MNVVLLGSSGSIGTQTLEVVEKHKHLNVKALAVNSNIDLLERQVRKHRPDYAVVYDQDKASKLRSNIADLPVEVLAGIQGMEQAASLPDVDVVVTAVSGSVGLKPTIAAIKEGKTIALANKETLVSAGEIVMRMARQYSARIIPVDSEHSAIFQCLEGKEGVEKIILTASGGPFRSWTAADMQQVTPQQAVKHPNWDMGRKISIDSATLMNKGLEVIEARWLFDLSFDDIQVVVHPQSIIHSAVSFVDGSILAHLGTADMRIPIQYALSYPHRWEGLLKPLDLTTVAQLTFEQPDVDKFPALELAFSAGRAGGTMPAVLNAANEVAVEAFLSGIIGFMDIPALVERVMGQHQVITQPDLEEILAVDQEARQLAWQSIKERR